MGKGGLALPVALKALQKTMGHFDLKKTVGISKIQIDSLRIQTYVSFSAQNEGLQVSESGNTIYTLSHEIEVARNHVNMIKITKYLQMKLTILQEPS